MHGWLETVIVTLLGHASLVRSLVRYLIEAVLQREL